MFSRDPKTSKPKAKTNNSKRGGRGVHRKPEVVFTNTEALYRLKDLMGRRLKLLPSDLQMKQFANFYNLLMEKQNTENFTRLLSLREVGLKHFVDSWIVADLVDLQFPLMDVGTGPGFPGIPLKIRYPNENIILAEGVQKRVEFLKTVRDHLELKNLDVLGRYITPSVQYQVQSIITRAVDDVSVTLENIIHCLPKGGKAFLMKGPNCEDEIKNLTPAAQNLFQLEKNIAYSIPETPYERRLLVFRKKV
jgi:16S rRNA (guanine527-N7)-methyltransferase